MVRPLSSSVLSHPYVTWSQCLKAYYLAQDR